MSNPTMYDPKRNGFGHGVFLDRMAKADNALVFLDCIDFFDETPEGDFLSNFYPSPLTTDLHVGFGLLHYATGEHAFQAAKAKTLDAHVRIANADDPGEAKYLGRTTDLRNDWEDIKVEVMRTTLAAKFPYTDDSKPVNMLSARLVNTGTKMLVEGTNWGDQVWGVAADPQTGQISGRNLLGVLLMERRGLLQAALRSQL